MSHEGIPPRFWDYVAEYVSEIRSRTAHPLYDLKGRTPIKHVTGETPDITEWLEYRMYQPVWYLDPGDFPEEKKLLGRWLGPAHRVGQAFCCWIVPKSGRVIARSTVQPVSEDERGLDSFKTRLKDFDKSVQDFLNRGDTHVPDGGISWKADRVYAAIDEDIDPVEKESTMPEADEYTEESFDKYLSAEVVLALGDGKQRAKVTDCKWDTDGNPVGIADSNPILDTRVYTVEFPDGTEKEYSANIIAESLYSEVDQDGRQFQLIDEIIDHSSDASAVSRDDMYVDKDGSNPHLRRTTKAWKLLIQWKDGTSTWERLANLKESNPEQVAEYAVANKLAEEPAFIWWIKDVLQRRD
jgi:hypothetical protein